MTAPDPSDIGGPAGEAGDLIERDGLRYWKAKAEMAEARLAALQQRFDETFSAETVVMDHFFPTGEAGDLIERVSNHAEYMRMPGRFIMPNVTAYLFDEAAARLAALQQERDEALVHRDVAIARAATTEALASSLQRDVAEVHEKWIAEADHAEALQRRVEELSGVLGKYWTGRYFKATSDADADIIRAALPPPEQGGKP